MVARPHGLHLANVVTPMIDVNMQEALLTAEMSLRKHSSFTCNKPELRHDGQKVHHTSTNDT
jgi:hypothetical protein